VAEIRAELEAGLRVRITDGAHVWYADEPVDKGGEDAAPNPYELLLGALAACTCATLKMYANHKGIALTGVSASIAYDRVHADDCAECDEDATGFIDRISTEVHITGDLSDAERNRLAQVARRCPVHKTLQNGVVFADGVTFG